MTSLSQRLIRGFDVFTMAATDPSLHLAAEMVPPGEVWRIDRYGFRVVTDQLDLVRAYVDVGSGLNFLMEWPAPANPFFYVDRYPFMMGPGERLALEMSGHDSGDVIHLIYFGVVLQNPDHIRPPDLSPSE